MAIIVGDIHGRLEKVTTFLAYRPDQEHVAVGDYLDSFKEPIELQLLSLQTLMQSNSILLWGNHDLHYLRDPLFRYPGYQEKHSETLQTLLEENLDRFRAAYVADGWLCTHAGVHAGLVKGRSVHELERLFCDEWELYLQNRGMGYALYKFAEACEGYYQFTLTRLLDHTVESVGISPTQIFGFDRDDMERFLNGLTAKYPDFINATFTHDLDKITLREDKTSADVLTLF